MIIRLLTLLLFIIRWGYWKWMEKKADKEMPKLEKSSWYFHMSKWVWWSIYSLVILQVLGVQLLPIPHAPIWFSLLGLTIVIIGTSISILARRQIAANWANGYEYQVKKNQELVTEGLYGVIRHPIYLGLGLSLIGGEMVAQSYLWISYIVGLVVAFYVQGKREEILFEEHFGEKYRAYKKHTKMLIPYIL